MVTFSCLEKACGHFGQVTMASKILFFAVITCCLISHSSLEEATKEKKIGKIKPPTPKTPNTVINDVTAEELVHIVDEHEHVAILFYEKMDKRTQKVHMEMEDMETEDLDVEIVR